MKQSLPKKIGVTFLKIALRPVAKFCLRNSLRLQEVQQVLKEVLVTEATKLLERDNTSVSASKLALITGVHRKDVTAIVNGERRENSNVDLLTKVLGQWQMDKKFSSSGKPKPLTCLGTESEFFELVRKVNKEINPYTVLFELERANLLERTDNKVIAIAKEFVPAGNAEDIFEMYEPDGADLIAAVEENAIGTGPKHFHLRTAFDNIPFSDLKEIEKWVFEEGEKFHRRARAKLARYDRDMSNKTTSEKATGRVSVTLFHYSSQTDDQ